MIAISYRRDDSLPIAGRLYDRLQAKFGKRNVFMDFDSIPPGVDFREQIKQTIERSNLVVAVIGPDWLGQTGNVRRIDDPADFVRLEIAYALCRGIPIIPLLVDETPMPKAEKLPPDIEALAFRNALPLDSGIDFHSHTDRLIVGIRNALSAPRPRGGTNVAEPAGSAASSPNRRLTVGIWSGSILICVVAIFAVWRFMVSDSTTEVKRTRIRYDGVAATATPYTGATLSPPPTTAAPSVSIPTQVTEPQTSRTAQPFATIAPAPEKTLEFQSPPQTATVAPQPSVEPTIQASPAPTASPVTQSSKSPIPAITGSQPNNNKLSRVHVAKIGFDVLLPTDLFPDAKARLADENTVHLESAKGCASVTFLVTGNSINDVYRQYVLANQSDGRTIDYKVLKSTWFVVSGSSRTTGFYMKGVLHRENVAMMKLEYNGNLCPIPPAVLAEIAQDFDGTESSGPSATTSPAKSIQRPMGDAELSRQLAGSWLSSRHKTTYQLDGTWTMGESKGRWRIESGKLITTWRPLIVVNGLLKKAPSDAEVVDEIIELSASTLRCRPLSRRIPGQDDMSYLHEEWTMIRAR